MWIRLFLITLQVAVITTSLRLPSFFRVSAPAKYIYKVKAVSNPDTTPEYEQEQSLKKEALSLLDCLTSARDEDDPEYDAEKDIRRENLLANNDYLDLKVELRRRGLRSSGDKQEMITRLLLHVIDPTINYNEMSGREPSLKFITKEDLSSGELKEVPESERHNTSADSGPDAEDMQVLRRGSRGLKQLTENDSENEHERENDLLVMDGLVRRQISLPLYPDHESSSRVVQQGEAMNSTESLNAYVVGGRNVLRTWERSSSPVTIL